MILGDISDIFYVIELIFWQFVDTIQWFLKMNNDLVEFLMILRDFFVIFDAIGDHWNDILAIFRYNSTTFSDE